MLAELRRSRDHLAFDQLPCIGTEYDDLDMASIRKAFGKVVREIDDSKLESLGVLIRYGKTLIPSNGGMILFGRTPVRDRYFPDAQVRCARFAGTEKVDFIDRLDIEGTVLDALTEVPKFIRRNTRMAAKIEGMQRQDIPEYPVIALREALTNAVAHTDYTLRGMQIMVAIFSDRLEIQNPGMLPFGMTLNDLKSGVSKIRNPVIARVLRELDYMEKWGTGYKRIIEDCDGGGYPHPEWQELSTAMRIKFQPHPIQVESGAGTRKMDQVGTKSALSRHQVQLLEFMKEPRSLREMMTLLGWTDRTKFRLKFIKPLLDRDLVKMTVPAKPTSRNQKYFAAENTNTKG